MCVYLPYRSSREGDTPASLRDRPFSWGPIVTVVSLTMRMTTVVCVVKGGHNTSNSPRFIRLFLLLIESWHCKLCEREGKYGQKKEIPFRIFPFLGLKLACVQVPPPSYLSPNSGATGFTAGLCLSHFCLREEKEIRERERERERERGREKGSKSAIL